MYRATRCHVILTNLNAQHRDVLILLQERKRRSGITWPFKKDPIRERDGCYRHPLKPAVSVLNYLNSNDFCRDFSSNIDRHAKALCCFGHCENGYWKGLCPAYDNEGDVCKSDVQMKAVYHFCGGKSSIRAESAEWTAFLWFISSAESSEHWWNV